MSARGSNLPHPSPQARFGVFEFDLAALKLSRGGVAVALQQQPAMLLAHLINRSGQVVTRAELKDAIWPSGTYVEFDFGLNTAVNRLRRALRDSASEPRYIETIPKVGYRFIAPVEFMLPSPVPGPQLVEPSEIEEPASDESPAASRVPPQTWARIAIPAVIVAALCGTWFLTRSARHAGNAASDAVVRSTLTLPVGHYPEVVIISPAGDQIVYQVSRGGVRQLYLRYLNEEESRPVPNSEGGTQPFFSPDGKQVGFFVPAAIRIAGPAGSRDLVSIPAQSDLRRAIWGEDHFVYYVTSEEGIWRVPDAGGKPELVLKPTARDRAIPFYFPQQVLAGNPPAMLYSTNNGPVHRWIAWAGLSGDPTGHTLMERAMGGQIVDGYLVYFWQGSLLAAPFDAANRRLTGAAISALNNVAANAWRGPNAGVSRNGTLVYIDNVESQNRMLWVDRRGRETPLATPPAIYEQAEVSPDGSRAAIVRREGPSRWSLSIYDLRSGSWAPVLTTEVPKPRAVWSPDGKSLVAAMVEGDGQFVNLYRITPGSTQPPERLGEQPDVGQFPAAWSAAANAILFTEGVHARTQSDIYLLPLSGDRKARALVATPGVERDPAFSPDGRWFAYASDQGNGPEVFLQPVDGSSPPRQVSTGGGLGPLWSPDGKHIYYLNRARALLEVPYSRDGKTGEPSELLGPRFAESPDWWTRGYAVAPDGRFLVIRTVPQASPPVPQIHIIVNWTAELKRLAPAP